MILFYWNFNFMFNVLWPAISTVVFGLWYKKDKFYNSCLPGLALSSFKLRFLHLQGWKRLFSASKNSCHQAEIESVKNRIWKCNPKLKYRIFL